MSGHDVGVVLTALLASGVEFVEALTIVLAMGTDARLALGAGGRRRGRRGARRR